MKVKIRKEKENYLVYFLDSRRLVGVSEVGAEILELLFNQNKTLNEIVVILSEVYNIPYIQIRQDIKDFLFQLKKELLPNSFNVVDQEQMNSPLGVEIEITTSCNLRCRHCVQEGQHNEVFMDYKKFIGIIDILSENGVCEISLMGGEPFQHNRIFDILDYCQKKDFAVNLVTNATLIKDSAIERFSSFSRLMLLVSLDGIQLTHDYIRGKNIFAKVDNVLKKFIKREIPAEVLCTLNSYNALKYKEVLEYCKDLDILCNFNLFKPFLPKHSELVLDPKIFFEIIIDLFRLRRDEGYKIGMSNSAIAADLLGMSSRDECRATKSGLVIDVQGRMITCPSLVAAGYYEQKELPLFGHDFLEKWRNHEVFQRFRKNGLRECQARSLIFNGNVLKEDPYGIKSFKTWKEAH